MSLFPRSFCVALAIAVMAGTAGPAASGDAGEGAKVFRKCKACHMVGADARHKVGPHLNELFGRKAGGISDFDGYSKDMLRMGHDGLVWDGEKLEIYLSNPKTLVSGTNMKFRGLKEAEDRADVIAFLRQYSASPSDIPEAAPTAAPRDPDVDPAILAIEGDPEYGEYLSAECTTCHQASGADEGIPSITNWPREDFVVALHAYKNAHRPHPVMQLIARNLSDEEIAALAAYFESAE